MSQVGTDNLVTGTASDKPYWVVLAATFLLSVVCAVFIVRYGKADPYVDEWEFVPVLFGETPVVPWLWELHNEHRFPLPRICYLACFALTGDLRAACFLNLAILVGCCLQLLQLCRKLRGTTHLADLFLPTSLLHPGHDENLLMGYQICFAFVLFFATIWIRWITLDRRSVRGGLVLAIASCLCGAAGLLFGIGIALWSLRNWWTDPNRNRLFFMAYISIPTYLICYRQGYHPPDHHPPSAGILLSLREALAAQITAYGPAGAGSWPISGILFLIGFCVLMLTVNRLAWRSYAILIAVGFAVAFSIGWGRSGFRDNMGLAWRYGWLTWPLIGGIDLMLVKSGHRQWMKAFAIFAFVCLPANLFAPFNDGETKLRPAIVRFHDDLKQGCTAKQIVDRHFAESTMDFQEAVIRAIDCFRRHRYGDYAFVEEESS